MPSTISATSSPLVSCASVRDLAGLQAVEQRPPPDRPGPGSAAPAPAASIATSARPATRAQSPPPTSPAIVRSVSRSSPKILMTISAGPPVRTFSISRCVIGWPMLNAAGIAAEAPSNPSRICVELSGSIVCSRMTSISLTWTPLACSSASERPVRRPTRLTSGTASSMRSAADAIRLNSSSEMPG